jgi:hypothetical protein
MKPGKLRLGYDRDVAMGKAIVGPHTRTTSSVAPYKPAARWSDGNGMTTQHPLPIGLSKAELRHISETVVADYIEKVRERNKRQVNAIKRVHRKMRTWRE